MARWSDREKNEKRRKSSQDIPEWRRPAPENLRQPEKDPGPSTLWKFLFNTCIIMFIASGAVELQKWAEKDTQPSVAISPKTPGPPRNDAPPHSTGSDAQLGKDIRGIPVRIKSAQNGPIAALLSRQTSIGDKCRAGGEIARKYMGEIISITLFLEAQAEVIADPVLKKKILEARAKGGFDAETIVRDSVKVGANISRTMENSMGYKVLMKCSGIVFSLGSGMLESALKENIGLTDAVAEEVARGLTLNDPARRALAVEAARALKKMSDELLK